MIQSLFTVLTRLFHKTRNLLKARVVIYAYQHHVRLLSPEPVVIEQPKSTRVEEPTLLWNHLELLEGFYGREPEWLLHIRNRVHFKFRNLAFAGMEDNSYCDAFGSCPH